MSSGAVAERYARAIFELAVEASQLEAISEQFGTFAKTYAQNRDLRIALESPLVDAAQSNAVLRELAARLGLNELATNAVRFLAKRRRLSALPDIARRLGSLADERASIVRATVISAAPLPESYYQRLISEFEALTHSRVALEREVDPSLIAGVVTRIGGKTIDGSVKGRLAEIERQLLSSS